MQKLSNAVMVALVVAALFSGNCFSCPQFLLALGSHQPSHGCCHRNKSANSECQTQALRHFVKTEPGRVVAPAACTVDASLALAEAPPADVRLVASSPADHAPPDLFAFHSSFRI